MTPTRTLAETVDLMLSSDRADQIKAEYYQLENRFIALTEMLVNWDIGRLDPAPKGNRYMYGEMLNNMRNYMTQLKSLAAAEGIDIPVGPSAAQ